MKVIGSFLHIECSCGHEIEEKGKPRLPALPSMMFLDYQCPACGNAFFVHIQEVNKNPAK